MARIRSVHPTQWNDDDFLECSPFARLLSLALRNFADDNGVFEWKPQQIKRNCLPADACDVKPLLRELIEHKQIVQFTVDGRDYGVIRNFRKWQRPKAPKPQYPLPPELRNYAGLEVGPISEIDDDEEGVNSVKPIADVGGRRLDVGGRRKEVVGRMEEIKTSSLSLRSSSCPEPSQAQGQQVLEIDGGAVISLPTNRPGEEVAVTAFEASEYQKLYPAVDLDQELRAMRGWLLGNPKLRKTKAGMLRFINNWLAKAQNRGKGTDHGRRQERGHSAFIEGAFRSANEDPMGHTGRNS